MDDRGLRDIERWRDKIEVHLDNRQVFFLFFGSALVACMLFVLGVIVGKRLESRGRALSPEIEDPLALLDKVATSPRTAQSSVTFPQALFGTATKNSVDKHGKKGASAASPAPEAEAVKVAALAPQEAKVDKTSTKPAPVVVAEVTAPEPASKSSAEKSTESPAEKVQAPAEKPQPVAEKPAPVPEKATATKAVASKPAPSSEGKPVTIPLLGPSADGKSKGHFALQLSSFQDKAEAEAFAQKFQNDRPYMIASEIPGKGTWYRVRVGDYPSAKDALQAKQIFERKHSVIAYVAQR
jgi:cell division septation protein DedD